MDALFWIETKRSVGVLINLIHHECKLIIHDSNVYRNVREDIDQEDDQESFYRYMEENPMAGVILDEDDQPVEYDEDGNPIIPEKNKVQIPCIQILNQL